MKLSANAKEFVKAEVKAAFADDLKKANVAVEVAKKAAADRYKAFECEYDKMKVEFVKKLAVLIGKHGLSLAKRYGADVKFEVEDVITNLRGPFYGDLKADTFEETSDEGSAVRVAADRVNGVESDIGRAVAKALFEIEVHGKKDTLEQIVADVIREIREGE